MIFFKFQLTIQASDGRGKAANATATIRITRIPSDQRPQFISTPNTTLTLRQPVNSRVFTVLAQDPDLVVNQILELMGDGGLNVLLSNEALDYFYIVFEFKSYGNKRFPW